MAKFSKFLIFRQNLNSHAWQPWQQLKNFIDSCCCVCIFSVMGKMTMRPENFQSEKGSNASGRYHQRRRGREGCINMRHAIWRNICWNLCLLFNRSSLLLCRNCTLRAEILPQWSIITRNTAWGKYSKTL